MSPLKIYKDNYSDSTVITNRFIDEYMKDANDAQLKIYLYLIRMISANLPTSIADIADKFNHTEKDVVRALKYWEKNKILTIVYDENSNIVGIHLRDLDRMPGSQIVSLSAKNTTETVTTMTVTAEPVSIAAPQEPSERMSRTFEKPSYSLDDLKAFKNNEESAQILFIAEQYLGKTLSVSEVRTILFIYDVLGFSMDLIDYLIEYCVGKGKKEIRYIEKVAVNWAEENITTVKQAKAKSSKYDKSVYAIMKALGRSSEPTDKEVSFIKKWINDYAFSKEIILAACEKTSLATDRHRFEYTDGILNRWKVANVKKMEDVTALEASFQKARSTPAAKPLAGKFSEFQQNSYDFESLEQELVSN